MLALVSLAVFGCSRAVDRAIDRAVAPDVVTSAGPELVREAAEFGGWVVPVNAKVLMVRREIVRHKTYRMAVEMSPDDFRSMLEQSRFTATFRKLYETSLETTIAGPNLASSPNIETAQDLFVSPTGPGMTRTVTVDERDADTRIAHITFSAE
ncbi:hypothetical protein ACQP2U_12920 [Nocardia sp. CA-084685]|uniref:hypothetical protein n=1 Tax=Nocardia sp. CA-084685 TaxID=3239970 RepID=UPI003D95CD79